MEFLLEFQGVGGFQIACSVYIALTGSTRTETHAAPVHLVVADGDAGALGHALAQDLALLPRQAQCLAAAVVPPGGIGASEPERTWPCTGELPGTCMPILNWKIAKLSRLPCLPKLSFPREKRSPRGLRGVPGAEARRVRVPLAVRPGPALGAARLRLDLRPRAASRVLWVVFEGVQGALDGA